MKLFEAHYKHRLLSLEEFHSRKTLESAAWAAEQGPSAPEPSTIYDIEVKNAQGEVVPLSKYNNGKVTLIVNVASNCGYTDQYAELVTLQENFGDDIQILAFPSNDFEGQEPDDIETICKNMKEKYNVNFEIFDKVTMQHPLFKFLSSQIKTEIEWNFWKFIVRPYGTVRKAYQHWVKPLEFESFLEHYMLELYRAGEL